MNLKVYNEDWVYCCLPPPQKPLGVLGRLGREKKRKRIGDYGRKTLLLILLEYPAGASIWGRAEHRCRSPWPGALICHETLGDKLCPYLFTCRRSNSRERFIPSNQNKVMYYVTRSHTQVQKNSSQQWRTGVMLQCPISLVSWFVKAVYLLVVHMCFNSYCLLFFFLFP